MKTLFTNIFLLISLSIFAQEGELVNRTFKDTRVINAHSVETLAKRKLDIRIGHRFGDLFGANGGWPTFYGLENAADVVLGGEYGVTNDLTVGLYRSKGGAELRQLVNMLGKYKIIGQKNNGFGYTITAMGLATVSTMPKIEGSEGLASFEKAAHRWAYTTQVIIGKKFSDKFSLQAAPTVTHRNLVRSFDENTTYSLGIASRFQVTKVIGLIFDANIPLNGPQSILTTPDPAIDETYYPALAFGLEFDTGGHIFQINLTNATGMTENDYIPNTTSNWADGEFRLGFTISRLFNL